MALEIPLPSDSELAPEVRATLASLPPLNIFRMLANAPTTLKTFVDWGLSLLFQTELDARHREIAILRVAHVTRSKYEWHQHAIIARDPARGSSRFPASPSACSSWRRSCWLMSRNIRCSRNQNCRA